MRTHVHTHTHRHTYNTWHLFNSATPLAFTVFPFPSKVFRVDTVPFPIHLIIYSLVLQSNFHWWYQIQFFSPYHLHLSKACHCWLFPSLVNSLPSLSVCDSTVSLVLLLLLLLFSILCGGFPCPLNVGISQGSLLNFLSTPHILSSLAHIHHVYCW